MKPDLILIVLIDTMAAGLIVATLIFFDRLF